MREIKFRAWDKEDKEMINAIWIAPEYDWQVFADNDAMCERKRKPANTYVLMQYTGLKDKNGVEIYEGDYIDEDRTYYIGWCDRCIGWQCFTKYAPLDDVACHQCDGNFSLSEILENAVVSGNIYENPELLNN